MCIKKEQLPDEIPQQDSEIICDGETRKDNCHHNLITWNNGDCKRFIAPLNVRPENFVICGEDGERSLTIDDIIKWKQEHPEYPD